MDAITAIITTVAGTGSFGHSGDGGLAINAGLEEPWGVALDKTGSSLYITEGHGCRIRKVNLITGIITTIAGTGVQGYNGDGILAINAELNLPTSLAVDTMNNIYFRITIIIVFEKLAPRVEL